MNLKYFKLHESAHELVWGTPNSACFDICAHLMFTQEITCFLASNKKFNTICCQEQDSKKYIELTPSSRTLIPTGIILKIPPKHSVRIHPRSGLALNHGIVLANSEGIIDEDYTQELFVMLTNISMNSHKIYDGDRIAQGELIVKLDYSIERDYNAPSETTRTGGFGSTGVNIQNENKNH